MIANRRVASSAIENIPEQEQRLRFCQAIELEAHELQNRFTGGIPKIGCVIDQCIQNGRSSTRAAAVLSRAGVSTIFAMRGHWYGDAHKHGEIDTANMTSSFKADFRDIGHEAGKRSARNLLTATKLSILNAHE